MTAACERVRTKLPDYARESLSDASGRDVREHLRVCAECRVEAARLDPTLLFAAIPAEPVDSAEVDSVVAAVRGAIDWREAERRVAPASSESVARSRRRTGRVAAAAAVFLLTLAVPSGLRSPAPRTGAASAEARPAAVTREGTVKTSGGATVYDWNPGAGEPRVVWIVDGSLDI